jgi:hypothetical protein
VVLRIRLQALDFGTAKGLNLDAVQKTVKNFMKLTTGLAKVHGGTIVSCASGATVVMWPTVDPGPALLCATAVAQKSRTPVTQVLQSGRFLSGNLAASQLRSFNLLGPADWAGQMLLRAGDGLRLLFLIGSEGEDLKATHHCLPYEQILLNGVPTTVWSVTAATAARPMGSWTSRAVENVRRRQQERIEDCFSVYCDGSYTAARELLSKIGDAPEWYSQHLLTLIDQADAHGVTDPVKSLEALAWVMLKAPPADTPPVERLESAF